MVEENKATVSYVQLLKEDLMIMRLVPRDGPVPDFEAGQFITLGLPGDDGAPVRRAYSIASSPENKEFIELVIRWVRKPIPGRLTTKIFDLKEGDEISWLKPAGTALSISEELPDGSPDRRRIVCIGGGTGIAPFISFAQHLRATDDPREIIVLQGASYIDELSYKGLLTSLEDESRARGRKGWDFRYRAAISRPGEWFNRSWGGQSGRVETFLRPGEGGTSPLEEMIGEKITRTNTIFYICGWQGTVDGVMQYLKPAGLVAEKDKRDDGSFEIKYESYG
ncbi:MAG: FAD-binding oxidoreductase [Nitrosopumilus sp.]|nr:FAD-binding oxidoreductase [Nitrosopumilus sp.]CAI9832347.1 Oxidoreductase FAD/NAD(P)-binding subunit [Nitrosopumilaceae archaeon]MDA7945577.1 FAD-binding oxidoreductase [Nitrosopumilus sp.]MDA7953768.1 FAD-binding oxidoreductase [Nitrosopumilus sp.]MDA7955436.1 FAD-binding oxidoreductase [Nitrosopumilus sp.]